MFTAFLYLLAAALLCISWRKNRQKTVMALRKAKASCLGVLPLFLGLLLAMGLLLSFVDDSVIRQIIGRESGFLGICISALIGSATLIPAFAAYPAAAELLSLTGAYAQITMLITSLMLVGIATLPVEIRFFGLRASLWRNGLGLLYSFALALFLGAWFGGM